MKLQIEKPVYMRNDAEENLFHEIRTEVNAYLNITQKPVVFLAVKFSFYFGLLAGFYALLFSIQSFAGLALAYISMGLLLVLLGFNFAHDFAHNALFKKQKLNNFCFEMLFMLMGINGYLWKKRHVHSHHNYPNTEGYDVDIELSSIIHLSENKIPLRFHKFQHLYAPVLYLTYSLYWIFYKDFILFHRKRHANLSFQRHETKEWIKFWGFKIIYVGYIFILPVIFSPFSMWQVGLAFLVMHLLQSWFLLFTLLISHHVESTAYHTPDNTTLNTTWFMQQITSSNDVHPFSKAANFIFGGFNCHVAHHLFPAVCHVYYPQISRIIYAKLNCNKVVVNTTSYFGGIASHLRLLKILGKPTAHLQQAA